MKKKQESAEEMVHKIDTKTLPATTTMTAQTPTTTTTDAAEAVKTTTNTTTRIGSEARTVKQGGA